MGAVALNVPAGVGVGTSSYIGELDAPISIVVAGNFVGYAEIEVSGDGTFWAVAVPFYFGGTKYLNAPYQYARIRVVAVDDGSIDAVTLASGVAEFLISSEQTDDYDQIRVVNKSLRLSLMPTNGLSPLRNGITLTGAATADEANGEGVLTLTANGADSAKIRTNVVTYAAGRMGEVGVGIRLPATAPVGNQVIRWGALEQDDGFFFGWDATGLFVGYRKNTVDTIVRQEDWNVDTMDGNGPSGIDILPVLQRGTVTHIEYRWYGYGSIGFEFFSPRADGSPRKEICHRFFDIDGLNTDDPQVSNTVEVSNNGTAAAIEVYFGGRQISTIGDHQEFSREVCQTTLGVGPFTTTWIPLVSFRRLATFRGRPNNTNVVMDSFSVLADANCVVAIFRGHTLGGAAFATPSLVAAAETVCEADIAATTINLTGATALWETLIASGSGSVEGQIDSNALDDRINGTEIRTLAIRSVTGNASASATLRWREEW